MTTMLTSLPLPHSLGETSGCSRHKLNCFFRQRVVCCLILTGTFIVLYSLKPLPIPLLQEDHMTRKSLVRTSQLGKNYSQESSAARATFSHHNNGPQASRPFLALNFSSEERSERFPSVEERLRIYLGDWYVPPCDRPNSPTTAKVRYWFQNKKQQHQDQPNASSTNATTATATATSLLHLIWINASGNEEQMQVQPDIRPDNLFYLDRAGIRDCYENPVYNIHQSCKDLSDTLLPVMDKFDYSLNDPPILLQFGDNCRSLNHGHVQVPLIRKRRRSMDRSLLADITDASTTACHEKPRLPALEVLQGIIWRLDFRRLYGNIPEVYRSDISYSRKINMAIFWGGPNGADRKSTTPTDLEVRNNDTNATERQKCWAIPRCRFVYMYHNSTLISAKLHKTRGKVADVIDGIPLAAEEGRKSIQELLQYKALVMLEGNDVSSGLTWALFSNSVVMIPPPTFTSYAMEEVLEPYVHYVPLKRDLSDAEEQVQWILANDDAAQRIAQNGRNWIRDMFLHDDSQKENDRINEEIVRRYRMHFVPAKKNGDFALASSNHR